eukprot:Hpha_TRINITY_DN6000_c0_g1::TRINITY_DN6000_c0_g1_i1::g.63391::m.63391
MTRFGPRQSLSPQPRSGATPPPVQGRRRGAGAKDSCSLSPAALGPPLLTPSPARGESASAIGSSPGKLPPRLLCGNPTCRKPIVGDYIWGRRPGGGEEMPVCDEGCREQYMYAAAPECRQCSRKMMDNIFTLAVDGEDIMVCGQQCSDKYQEGLRPLCVNCGKHVPPIYTQVKVGPSDTPQSVCNEECFAGLEQQVEQKRRSQRPQPPDERVVLYGRHTCGECHLTAGALDRASIAYEFRNVDDDESYSDVLYDSGFKDGEFELPVVTFRGVAYWLEKGDDLVEKLRSVGL